MNISQEKSHFFQFTTQRPVAITMILIGILVFGWLSYSMLSLNLMPDITYPSLTVRTEYPGAAPEEVETAISRQVEEALGVVTNLVSISSISKAGQSDVILELNWDTDMNMAISEVREKLDMVFLPDDAEKPIILKYDPSLDPIIRLGLTGGQDLFFSRYVAEEQIKRALETVDGVASVKVKGGYEEEIRVELNEQKLTLLGLDIQQIRQRLAQENVNLAGGELKEGQTEYIVRTLNEFKNIDEIRNIRLNFGDRREIKLSDVANVYRTFKERQIITRLDGEESVELEIFKEGDANIVEVAKRVNSRVFGTAAQQAFVANMKAEEAAKAEAAKTAKKDEAVAEKDAEKKDEKKDEKKEQQGNQRGDFMKQMMMKQMTDFIANKLPDQMQINLLTDQSVFIENSIDEVKNTAVLGGVLAVIVLFLFLRNLATTLIVGLAIPISIIATFAPMQLFDVSLNIMSLGGLALGIGMLVDNAIVVIESIFRCREEGDNLTDSVVRGTGEVGGAVTASTLTTIAVFLPMVFVEGVAGQIFGDLSLTVVFSLLASLGVALFFIPMLASRNFSNGWTGNTGDRPKNFLLKFNAVPEVRNNFRRIFDSVKNAKNIVIKIIMGILGIVRAVYAIVRFLIQLVMELFSKIITLLLMVAGYVVGAIVWIWKKILHPFFDLFVRGFNNLYDRVQKRYPPTIDWALQNKAGVLILSVILFAFTVFVMLPQLGSELIPEVRQGEFNVELTLPVGTPVETTAEVISPIEEMLLAEPDVRKVSTVAGVDLTKVSDSESGEHTAKVTVTLDVKGRNPAALEDAVLADIRDKLSNFSGIDYKISRPVLFSFKTPIEVEIKGYSLPELTRISREAVSILSEIPGMTDVKSNLQRGNPEVQIVYNRDKLAFYGLNLMNVANTVRNKVRGDVATQFKKEDRRIDIRVKVRDQDKASIERLRQLVVNPGGNVPISLNAVASIEINEGPSEIRRIDQERSALILANIAGRDLSSVSEDVYVTLRNLDLPEGFTYEITGQNKEMEVSLGSLQLALLLAIFMVYIVMASQFESFVYPFVILFTMPFGLIGVVFVLWMLSIPLNIMVFLGLIMLAGIVVNNAIVLVDYINQMRRQGLPLNEAIKQAGQARLRPILMTTTTTVLGLLPMALGIGEGAEIRTPMAITVIAGLVSATVLTLIVIPTVYAVFSGKEIVTETETETESPEGKSPAPSVS